MYNKKVDYPLCHIVTIKMNAQQEALVSGHVLNKWRGKDLDIFLIYIYTVYLNSYRIDIKNIF